MNKEEAKTLFAGEVDRFQTMSHNDLVQTIDGEAYATELVGASGSRYSVKIKTKWKSRKKLDVRVSAKLTCLDESRKEVKTWNIPFLNSSISRGTFSCIVTTFTQRHE